MSNTLIIFIYTLCAYGACNVLVFGSGPFKIFEWTRYLANRINKHFGSMFGCMMCMPANFGWICSLVNFLWVPVMFTPFNILFEGHPELWPLILLCDGAYTSGTVWLIHHVEEWFENLAEGKNGEEVDDDIIEVEDITQKED